MSVRVVARVRPLLKSERELDVIVRTGTSATTTEAKLRETENGDRKLAALRDRDNVVRIPNPKNEGEEYTFNFNAVYDSDVVQQELFDAEVAPTIKHLFNGFDVTLFAYGVTGTGKTHTMRGGKSLADRGVIPRLLSGIYRRSRKIEKDTNGETTVKVLLSYYEIYNDKVYDLFEPPEKRTLAGLPLRDNGGKTVVCGLTEKPCTNLKEFEGLYDQANNNRSTSATKLNAHSSRSHAILGVKIAITSSDKTIVSKASAIDLAGSEDNRRTENDKERMVESASINKSLFVLAQCVEAITKKQHRIPYRESKMTRILSLGQNNGLTVMILNLAPVRSYHLDTISSLSVANRTRKIEVREIENDPIFKGPARPSMRPSLAASRQPLRPLTATVNVNMPAPVAKDSAKKDEEKPLKAFSVFSDRPQHKPLTQIRKPEPLKRTSFYADGPTMRSIKPPRQTLAPIPSEPSFCDLSAAKIEEMVEKKVEEMLAVRAVSEQSRHNQVQELNDQLQRRLAQLEQRIEGTEDARAEGLSYLLMAKQHQARGENSSALKMYQLALPHFPHNEKLVSKIAALKERMQGKPSARPSVTAASPPPKGRFGSMLSLKKEPTLTLGKRQAEDESYMDQTVDAISDDESSFMDGPRPKKKRNTESLHQNDLDLDALDDFDPTVSPKTIHLLSIINSRDVSQIQLLKGVGMKKAEAIVDCLCEMDQSSVSTDDMEMVSDQPQFQLSSLAELSTLKGVGVRTVESMRSGVFV
ncbi:hypothetical protein N7509_006745 [Penicillium cosmopolitanum]|uniref:Kinesin motor domain-containing protein n=1 Tax=Penicillium cosmopolitanum TaxID=1131564 RepID=A0A9W9VXY1_9EURO|nr:uncharacterized protein N7509_006745 [Penicillium cosmopolitanum]KAJ5391255.1 hypothetical protein N7509_006745 [Penicillium cosmopolitanum]